MEVGQDEVTLRTGKQANRRNIQFVLQALLALFGMKLYFVHSQHAFIVKNSCHVYDNYTLIKQILMIYNFSKFTCVTYSVMQTIGALF